METSKHHTKCGNQHTPETIITGENPKPKPYLQTQLWKINKQKNEYLENPKRKVLFANKIMENKETQKKYLPIGMIRTEHKP